MKFEKLYKKYQEGIATEEEIKYVEKEIGKAKKIIEQLEVKEKCEIEKADTELLTNAKKKFDKYLAIKTIVISVVSLIAVSVLITGAILAIAFMSANRNTVFTVSEAIELAETKLGSTYNLNIKEFIIEENEKELDIKLNLTKSFYVYELEFDNGDSEYKVHVNSSTGDVNIIDIEGVRNTINNDSRVRR